jgi:hypothetical protein
MLFIRGQEIVFTGHTGEDDSTCARFDAKFSHPAKRFGIYFAIVGERGGKDGQDALKPKILHKKELSRSIFRGNRVEINY